MNIFTINDPIRMVIKAAENIFPNVKAGIQYDPSLEDKGMTWAVAEDETGNNIIILDPSISVTAVAGALAEAIVSCYVGTHISIDDKKYKRALEKLVNEYDKVNVSPDWN
jgi:hypothetical protein